MTISFRARRRDPVGPPAHRRRRRRPTGGAASCSGDVDLAVTGMTCAACVGRVERRLNRVEGVTATVNLVTARARIRVDSDVEVAPADLVSIVEEAGYGAHVVEEDEPVQGLGSDADLPKLERRLRVSTALTVPAALLVVFPRLRFRGWQYVYLASAAPTVVWSGLPFHRRALRGVRHGSWTMDTLISLGTLSALASGAVRVIGGGEGHHDLEVATGVTTFMLGGRLLEARARGDAGRAIAALLEAAPREASMIDAAGREQRVAARDLSVGGRFFVRPGETVAVDGVVEEGVSTLDDALLTGESLPVDVHPGTEVVGGAVNSGGGRLTIRVTAVGADTALARIARLVSDAQTGKAPVQRLADRVAGVFVPAVIVVAVCTFAGWRQKGRSVSGSLRPALAVLVAACPCALGLATPAALMVGVGRGAELGLFIRSPGVLETTRQIDTVVLDKTGTLTTGQMELIDVITFDTDEDEVLRLAGAVEDASEHPVGRAIAAAAHRRLGSLPPVHSFTSTVGQGVEGVVEGRRILVLRPDDARVAGVELRTGQRDAAQQGLQRGAVTVAVVWEGQVRGMLALADTARPTSREAVGLLRRLGLRPVMVSGDHEAAARAVAAAVGIDEVHAGIRPEGKVAFVAGLQAQGRVVAVIGDGLNDAGALARADLGIAVGGGTDVAMHASDLTIASGDLRLAVDAIRLARRTLTTIKQNLTWAVAYNIVAVPLAACGRLDPVVASASMAGSSFVVLANSLRLRGFSRSASLAPHTSTPPAPG